MGSSRILSKWELIPIKEILKDLLMWGFALMAAVVGLVCAFLIPEKSQDSAIKMFLNVISVFFGVGIAAFGLIFGLLTREILHYFKGRAEADENALNKIIGKLWFVLSFDCAGLLLIFLCIPLFFLGWHALAMFLVASVALLIVGSTYNLINTAFHLLSVVRALPDQPTCSGGSTGSNGNASEGPSRGAPGHHCAEDN